MLIFFPILYKITIYVDNELKISKSDMTDSDCEHYWAPNGSYFCVHCGTDIQKQ